MTSNSRHSSRANNVRAPSGIIDTLGNAFAALNRRPYLIWLPIVLDTLMWTGLRVSVLDPLGGVAGRLAGTLTEPPRAVEAVRNLFSETELLNFVTLMVPTLLTDLGRGNVPALSLVGRTTLAGDIGLLALVSAATMALLLGISYLTLVGRLVTNRRAWGLSFAADCASTTLRLAGLAAAVVGLLAFLFWPFVALGLALNYIGFDVWSLLFPIGIAFVVWAALFFLFSVPALALGMTSPIDAMRASYQVVQRNLLSVLGLIAAVGLIRAGTPVALQLFTETRWSVPFAIVVNAYVGTGLIAAIMLYYLDRSKYVLKSSSSPVPAGTTG